MIKRIFTFVALMYLAGCASNGAVSKLSSLKESGELPEDTGILLVSSGRGPSGSLVQLPFVSYGVFLERSEMEMEMEKVAFLPAEAGFINQLGKGKYGYIHLRELKAGKYYLVGQKGRGNGLDNPLGILAVIPAGAVHYDSDGKKVGISMQFDIEAGKVNYLGEVLTVSRDLSPEAIKVSDQSERDYAFAKEKQPLLNNLEFKKQELKSFNKPSSMLRAFGPPRGSLACAHFALSLRSNFCAKYAQSKLPLQAAL